jgi:CMP-N,N'-diacetyllegionaminic acid synthase
MTSSASSRRGDMHVVGLIPARGGSKGIPRKNLAPLGGKPLITWTIDAALESAAVSDVVVTTDDPEIAHVAEETGARILERPEELARDETPMGPVIEHALSEMDCDVLVLLQPTSPLRGAIHIDESVELLRTSGADAVLSVVEVPHRFGLASLMAVDGDRVIPLQPAPTTRQGKAKVYARNGPAILALLTDRIGDDLYGGVCLPYVMDARDSVDVDEPFDLELAEFLLSRR